MQRLNKNVVTIGADALVAAEGEPASKVVRAAFQAQKEARLNELGRLIAKRKRKHFKRDLSTREVIRSR